jgi:hypothetical protein
MECVVNDRQALDVAADLGLNLAPFAPLSSASSPRCGRNWMS